ncbi:MAG: glycosyltransferase [Marinilabiliaceae bacterium]|nr:glycosyltransferase [Marinilabiliaceae bacterium]
MKISIITPSYNQGHFIEETIQSVINQGYQDMEYIIIDGDSTDNTVNIIEKYTDKITYWVSEPDHGQTNAINKGFKRATGDIVTWLNSDDVLVPGALHKVADQFENNKELVCLFGQQIDFNELGETLIIKKVKHQREWLYTTPYSQPSTFYKRKIFEDIGYLDESLHFSMDNDLFKRIVFYNYPILFVDDVYSKFRWHQDSKSSNLMSLCRENDKLILITFLESINTPISNKIIEFLKKTDLFHKPSKHYLVNLKFSDDDIRYAFTHFIAFYIGQWYNHAEFDKVSQAFSFFKVIEAKNLINECGLTNIYKRHKYIPGKFIKLFRKINQKRNA